MSYSCFAILDQTRELFFAPPGISDFYSVARSRPFAHGQISQNKPQKQFVLLFLPSSVFHTNCEFTSAITFFLLHLQNAFSFIKVEVKSVM